MSALPRITARLIAELLAQPVRRRPGEVGFAESAKLEQAINSSRRSVAKAEANLKMVLKCL